VTLNETISQSSNVIENVRTELAEIKAEQQALKTQNAELHEEIRSLRTRFDTYSASLPSSRSWASIAAGPKTTQSGTSLSRTAISENANRESNCLRTSTQPPQTDAEPTSDSFTRYLPTQAANEHIRNALRSANTTSEVQVAGVGTTKTRYVIGFKDQSSKETARVNAEWPEELGNGTKLVKPRFGVVVHRTPTEGF
jgi:regulator of replication initiation timing